MGLTKVFQSVSHGLAWFAKHVVSVAKTSEADIAKLAPLMPDIEAVTKMISPQAAGLEDAAFQLLGKYGAAAAAADAAVSAGGINVQLEQELHDKVVAFYQSVKDQIAVGVKPAAAASAAGQ